MVKEDKVSQALLFHVRGCDLKGHRKNQEIIHNLLSHNFWQVYLIYTVIFFFFLDVCLIESFLFSAANLSLPTNSCH